MDKWLLNPPVAFLIVFVFFLILGLLLSRLSYRSKKEPAPGSGKPYACGEDIQDHLSQPDYSQFFPFAFYFTIAHVATLMVTTVPAETIETLIIALVYIGALTVGLFILLRR